MVENGTNAPRRVVVAEDESLIRLDIVEILRDNGFEVVGEAGDGETAVALMATAAFARVGRAGFAPIHGPEGPTGCPKRFRMFRSKCNLLRMRNRLETASNEIGGRCGSCGLSTAA